MQLNGNLGIKPDPDCDGIIGDKWVLPCGYHANLMFNGKLKIYLDSFELSFNNNKIDMDQVPIYKTDKYTFKNPSSLNGKNFKDEKNYIKPKNWRKSFFELDEHNPSKNGALNPDFVHWIHIEPFSKFLKPYRVLNQIATIKAGKYKISINYSNLYDYRLFNKRSLV